LNGDDLRGLVSYINLGEGKFYIGDLCTSPDYEHNKMASSLIGGALQLAQDQIQNQPIAFPTVSAISDGRHGFYTQFGLMSFDKPNPGQTLVQGILRRIDPLRIPAALHFYRL
jgi:hypothetical protein